MGKRAADMTPEQRKRKRKQAYNAAYYAAHREELRAYQVAYRAAHREERRAYRDALQINRLNGRD